ncbi:Ger(x)C family spore germination protein [Paenibacillus silvisoli]|uniref:Ger(x)C family spore germination protein n=1 Tax=Paenibacillus silvisoli TaxID=3110539 RepID=UPI002804BBA6|nr:Ger(x)C family spore germination protein [Paenibacillus silvisoli]
MPFKKLLAIMLAAGLLTGCSDQRVVNEIHIVQTMGLDALKQGLNCTVLIGSFKKKGETDLQALSTAADSMYEIVPRLNVMAKHRIEYGQLGMVLFGQSYAERGIGTVLESLCRNPKISSSLMLGVTDTTASELLAKTRKSRDAYYLHGMIEQNVKNGNLPRNNLQTAIFNYFGEGRDLFLPHFKLDGEDIRIDGLALFRDDKMMATMEIRKAFFLKLMMQNTKNGHILVPLAGAGNTEDPYIQFTSAGSKAVYRLNRLKPTPSVRIDVRLHAQAKQYPASVDFESIEQVARLEKDTGVYIEKELRKVVAFCQTNGVDPAGIGDFVRSKSNNWSAEQFRAIYPKMEVNVNVDFTIVQPVLTQ